MPPGNVLTLAQMAQTVDQGFDAGWGPVRRMIVRPQVATTCQTPPADVLTATLPAQRRSAWVIRVQQSCAPLTNSAVKVNVSIRALKLVVVCTKRVWTVAANAPLVRQMVSASPTLVPM